jgi:transcriptional regulator of met regulon
LPVEEDVDFHVSLARASRNRFIASTVRLLRSNEALNSAVSAIHAKLGRPLIDHEEMIKALKDRSPRAAQTLMERHLTNMIAEVEHYWEEAFRKNSRSRGRLNRQDVIPELSTSASARRSRARCKGQQSTAQKKATVWRGNLTNGLGLPLVRTSDP